MIEIQESAYKLLSRAGQITLPINELEVATTLGATPYPYSIARKLLVDLQLWAYAQTVSGISFWLDEHVFICYSDSLSFVERREVILHECGHIHLGHITQGMVLGKSSNSAKENRQEQEADAFAIAMLAPVHLLIMQNIYNVQDIQRICHISKKQAQIVANTLPARRNFLKMVAVGCVALITGTLLAYSWHGQYVTPPVSPEPVVTQTVTPTMSVTVTDSHITQMVFITKHGTKYHLEDCYQIADSEKVTEVEVSVVSTMGYMPCKTCRPNKE